jgi:pimeloyl-ACP methyl ester carboxylesterase
VHALRAAWTACGLAGPIIVTAHSYGGAISLLTASQDTRVAGLVLVDALVPGATPDSEVEAVLAEYRPQYDELRRQAPELARSMIPLMEAYPATVKKLDAVELPARLPVIDIVAEHTTIQTPRTTELWRKAHAAFVARDRSRHALFAAGSSHKVARDKPELVMDAMLRMMGLVRPPRAPRALAPTASE